MSAPQSILNAEQLIDLFGGPVAFGKICGFKKNPGQRGSDMKRRNFVPVNHWPKLIAHARENGLKWLTYHHFVEATVGKRLD
jgi:hypothetical protein